MDKKKTKCWNCKKKKGCEYAFDYNDDRMLLCEGIRKHMYKKVERKKKIKSANLEGITISRRLFGNWGD